MKTTVIHHKGVLKSALAKSLEEATKPEIVLATLVMKAFECKGLKYTKGDLKRVANAFKKMLQNNEQRINLPISAKRLERAGITRENASNILNNALTDEAVENYIERLTSAIPEATLKAAQALTKLYIKNLLTEGTEILQEHAAQRAQFEANLYAVWGEAFDLLDVLVHTAREMGGLIDQHWTSEKHKRRTLKMSLLHHLVARACRVGSEVVVLLRSGHASGAHARWRAIHEISVVARLIAVDEKDMAERYVAHRAITRYQSTLAYTEYANDLGLKPVSKRTIAANQKARDSAIAKYGKNFSAPYGWASAALGRQAKRFDEIERLAGFQAFRPYYKYASQAIHASTQGTLEPEGLPIGHDMLLAGPSNYGLSDPGQLTGFSLVSTIRALLAVQTSFEATTYVGVLERLADVCSEKFHKAHLVIEKLAREDLRGSHKQSRSKK